MGHMREKKTPLACYFVNSSADSLPMADYAKRGGKPSFGARSGKSSFAKKSWVDRSSTGPVTHHKATCTKCGDSCEVPFKPVSGKPIFCRNCFVKTGDTVTGRAGDRFGKREYASHTFPTSTRETPKNDNDVVVRQLEAMNAKLERLIQVVETLARK